MKLEIGSGNSPHEGYVHLDINPKAKCVDIVASAESIPLEDCSVDKVLAVHVIEHFHWVKTPVLLKEWARVIKPGGCIELHCPDIEYIISSYLDGSWKEEVNIPGWGFPHGSGEDKNLWLNFKIMSSCAKWDNHYAVFSFDLIKKRLEEAGFYNVGRLKNKRSLNVIAIKKGSDNDI